MFRNQYAFLSNMYDCKIEMAIGHEAYIFRCAEAAFQAHKCPERAHEFELMSGSEAKAAGRHVQLRPDWERIKDEVMKTVIEAKFQNPELLKKLQSVQGEICEDNTWRDTYWGKCNGVGQNKLGKILMSIRDESLGIKTPNAQHEVPTTNLTNNQTIGYPESRF